MTGADSPVIAELVDRGDALDDLAVGRDDVARFHDHDVADLETCARNPLVVLGIRAGHQLGLRLRALLAQRVGLRLAAAFGDCLCEIGKQHREPEPEDDLEREAQILFSGNQVANEDDRGE